MMKMLVVCLIFAIFFTRVSSWDGPEVELPLGKVKGTWGTSFDGKKFSSFEGVPYAEPPVSDLRFEEPVPIGSWHGIRPAINSYWCTQIDILSPTRSRDIIGNEDCLYLNVYVPGENINISRNYDVLVDIHGGAFMMGSPTLVNNPPYIMDTMDDMILVSINYRLNVFGFLSTEDDVIPGNNGMKDQVLALKWVKKYIGYFGGNPNSVTISGYSAGGASVHLHTLSPLSRGLFHKAHVGSGTALSPWAIREKPLEVAKKLAVATGCPSEPSQALKECLKTRPSDLLQSIIYDQLYGYDLLPFSPFAVVIEKNGTNPFLPKLPYQLIVEGNITGVPMIFSVVRDDGLFPSGYFCKNPEEIENIWTDEAHYLLDYNYTLPLEQRLDVAKQIKDLYMGPDAKINETTFFNFTKIFTDRIFVASTEAAAKLHSVASNSPVYFYYFNYQSTNMSSSSLFCEKGDIGGIAHAADELICIGFNYTQYMSESDREMKDWCHQMQSSFAKTGVPSFNSNVTWCPTSSSNQLTYLNITGPNDMKIQNITSLSKIDFWRGLNLAENEKDVFPN